MARSYTNVTTSIWDDPTFCALSAGAQRTYFMLITQTDITAAGTLALTLRRWARTCSEKDLDAWLAELADRSFVLIDEDSEELLVRTFVKWDGGYKHAQRVKAVIATARAIRSPLLRSAVATELTKLGVTTGIEVTPDSHPSGTEQEPPSGRVVVNEGEYEQHSTLPIPQPPTPTPVAAEPPTSAQTIVAEWMERTAKRPPNQVVGQVAKHVGQMLEEGIDPNDVRRGLAAWMTKGIHPSTLPSVVNEVMNAPSAGRPPPRRGTDDKVRDHLALAARLAAEQQQSTDQPRQIGA